jgi:predicted nuclease of predicted toxin-antitoxin system
MRIKLDENLPTRLAPALIALGHDVDTVPAEGLAGRADPEIWAAAQRANRFFITQDLDFSDSRTYAPGSHHGLLLVRLREPGRNALLRRVLAVFANEGGASLGGCFVVASDRKTRTLRP